jgi:hypothetical protein
VRPGVQFCTDSHALVAAVSDAVQFYTAELPKGVHVNNTLGDALPPYNVPGARPPGAILQSRGSPSAEGHRRNGSVGRL